MLNGDLRSIAREYTLESPNPFFTELQNELHQAFVLRTDEPPEQLRQLYISQRKHGYPPDSCIALFNKMPCDIQEFTKKTPDGPGSIGVIEQDLLDFLFHYRKVRVLSLVGPIGVGKTTLLRYLLLGVRQHCASLNRFLPIMIDCLAPGTNDPSYAALISECIRGASEAIPPEHQSKLMDLKTEFERICYDVGEAGRSDASIMLNFAEKLQNILAKDFELVFVFDNVDQLAQQAVSRICDVARGIFYTTKATVIVSMRPATYRTHIELSHEKGAFIRFRIDVSAPDLRSVIRARMHNAFDSYQGASFSEVQVGNVYLSSLHIKSIIDSVDDLAQKILDEDSEKLLLIGVGNNNIRKALNSFLRFLSYRNLDFKLLFPQIENRYSSIIAERPSRNWFDHFLDGLMIGPNRFYSENPNAAIANVLSYVTANGADYVIIYRVLALLDWASRWVRCSEFEEWLNAFGYDKQFIQMVMGHLIKKDLVYVSDGAYNMSYNNHVIITCSGGYYLHHLLKKSQYFWNTIFDVWLEHRSWENGKLSEFGKRVDSFIEYLERLKVDEKNLVFSVLQDKNNIQILGSIKKNGFLIRRALTAIRSILSDAIRSRSHDVHAIAQRSEEKISIIERDVVELERTVNNSLVRNGKTRKSDSAEVKIPLSINNSEQSYLVFPSEVAPADSNKIRCHVDLQGYSEDWPLSAFIRSLSPSMQFGGFMSLEKLEDSQTYFGSFTIPNVRHKERMPDFTFVLLKGTRALVDFEVNPGKNLRVL